MTTYLTLAEFTVDLDDFNDAITTIQAAATAIGDDVTQINTTCATLETEWISPAATTFAGLAGNVKTAMGTMTDLLEEMISRMQTSAQNYRATEQANTNNVS